MSIFIFELKSTIKSYILWMLSILCVIGMFYELMYPILIDTKSEVLDIFNAYPEEMLVSIGMDIDAIFSSEGFFDFVYGYIVLFSAIMGVNLSISILGREKIHKCVEFLYTKPSTQLKVYTCKVVSLFVEILVCNLVLTATVYYYLEFNGYEFKEFISVINLFLSMFLPQIMFASIGMLIATILKKIKASAIVSISVGVGFIGFIISMISRMFDDKLYKLFAVCDYFAPMDILKGGSFDMKYFVVGIGLTIVCVIVSIITQSKRDIMM